MYIYFDLPLIAKKKKNLVTRYCARYASYEGMVLYIMICMIVKYSVNVNFEHVYDFYLHIHLSAYIRRYIYETYNFNAGFPTAR